MRPILCGNNATCISIILVKCQPCSFNNKGVYEESKCSRKCFFMIKALFSAMKAILCGKKDTCPRIILTKFHPCSLKSRGCREGFKLNKNITTARHRLNMLNLMTVKIDNMRVEPLEINNDGISYTYKTINYIFKKYNQSRSSMEN